jgi:hypothetical protein
MNASKTLYGKYAPFPPAMTFVSALLLAKKRQVGKQVPLHREIILMVSIKTPPPSSHLALFSAGGPSRVFGPDTD